MRKENTYGFSLLEVMIAIVIALTITSFIVIGVLGAQRINTQSQDMREASNVAEDKIEQLKIRTEVKVLAYEYLNDGQDDWIFGLVDLAK